MKRTSPLVSILSAVLLFLTPLNGFATESRFLPESHHQRYQTYGLFIDNQTTMIYRDGGRAWGALGATFALLGQERGENSSQLVVAASVNTAFRLDDGLNPETGDARVTITWDTSLDRDWLLSTGYNHASGHVSDGVLPGDQGLMPLDVGLDSLPMRVIYDGSEIFRPGFTLKPLLFSSNPRTKLLQANEFLEWYPWGRSKSYESPTPYLALGLEQYGRDNLQLSIHAQAGAYIGNHRDLKKTASLRGVLGFYSGQDPRLKYYYYKNNHVTFGYLGFMLDL